MRTMKNISMRILRKDRHTLYIMINVYANKTRNINFAFKNKFLVQPLLKIINA